MTRPTSIWFNDEELELIKSKSKKEKRSVSNFVKWRIFNDEKDKD
jgi:hypothetical protein